MSKAEAKNDVEVAWLALRDPDVAAAIEELHSALDEVLVAKLAQLPNEQIVVVLAEMRKLLEPSVTKSMELAEGDDGWEELEGGRLLNYVLSLQSGRERVPRGFLNHVLAQIMGYQNGAIPASKIEFWQAVGERIGLKRPSFYQLVATKKARDKSSRRPSLPMSEEDIAKPGSFMAGFLIYLLGRVVRGETVLEPLASEVDLYVAQFAAA